MQPGMRQAEPRLRDLTGKVQNVDIQRPGGPADPPFPAKLQFYAFQDAVEAFRRPPLPRHSGDHVGEIGLGRIFWRPGRTGPKPDRAVIFTPAASIADKAASSKAGPASAPFGTFVPKPIKTGVAAISVMAAKTPITAEAPRDCPLCPRLVDYRQDNAAKNPEWFNGAVPSFGDPNARLW